MAFAAILLPLAVSAPQDPPAEEPGTALVARHESEWSFDAFVFGRVYGTVDLEDAAGDLGTHRLGLAAAATRRLSDHETLRLGVSVERSAYDFGGVPIALDRDPFGGLTRVGINSTFSRREDASLDWSASLYVNSGRMDGADFSDSLTWGLGGLVRYRFSEAFGLSLGLYGTTRLEDDFTVFPVSAIDWRITDRLHIGDAGSGVGIGWKLDDDLHTYGNVAFAVRQFRLDDPELAGDFAAGVFRDDELSVNVGVVWTPREDTRAELFGGVALRQLTFLDAGGAGLQEDLEPGPYGGVSFRFTP